MVVGGFVPKQVFMVYIRWDRIVNMKECCLDLKIKS